MEDPFGEKDLEGPEIKFLKRQSQPRLYVDELKFNRDNLKGPVFVVPDPFAKDSRDSRDPFRFDLDEESPENLHQRQPHNPPRLPNPSNSKKAAVAIGNSSSPDKRVTIRLPADSKGELPKAGGASVPSKSANDADVEKGLQQKKGKQSFGKRLCSSMSCCGKKKNMSELQLIDEKANKRGKPMGEKTGAMSKLNCCGKKSVAENEMVNITSSKVGLSSDRIPTDKSEDAKPGCMSCCRRKNKIRDSSADRRHLKKKKWYEKMVCCKSKKQKQQESWAARKDSMASQTPQPGCCTRFGRFLCCKKGGGGDRRPSMFSKNRSLSQAVPMEDNRSKLDPTLIEHNSSMRGAIPALPVSLAWTCLICNIIIPGLGTFCSGMFCLCFGRPRFGVHDGWKPRLGAFLIDTIIGMGQLFTVLFCLVGWGWSIWWGTIMIKVAKKYRKLQKLNNTDPENPPATAATNNNHRPART